MSNHYHNNPLVSIMMGSVFSMYAVVENAAVHLSPQMELVKVVSFGLAGGVFGYIGKSIAYKIHMAIKKRNNKKAVELKEENNG